MTSRTRRLTAFSHMQGTRAAAIILQAWGRQHIVRAAYIEIMKNKAEWSNFGLALSPLAAPDTT